MTDSWIFLAKRENESISYTRDIINRKSWDFVPYNKNKIPPRKPNNGNLLKINDLIIFYYSYDKSIIAKARIKSELYYKKDKWWVDLKSIKHFNPIKVKPIDDLKINHSGSIYPFDCEIFENLFLICLNVL